MGVRSIAFAAALSLVAASANAATLVFNFEALPFGAVPGESLTLTQDGVDVTFTGTGLKARTLPDQFIDLYVLTHYLSTTSDVQDILVSIDGFFARSATIFNPITGIVDDEVDRITGSAFDAAGNTVAGPTESIESVFTLTGSGITGLRYSGAATGYVLGVLVLEGDFVEIAPVPVPPALPMLAVGLLGLGLFRRKRRV